MGEVMGEVIRGHRRSDHLLEQVAGESLNRRPRSQPLLDHVELLPVRQRAQAQVPKVLLEAARIQSCWARRDNYHMALRCEHLGHVPLDHVAHLAALVDPIDEKDRAARAHSLTKHSVEIGVAPMLHLPQVGVEGRRGGVRGRGMERRSEG